MDTTPGAGHSKIQTPAHAFDFETRPTNLTRDNPPNEKVQGRLSVEKKKAFERIFQRQEIPINAVMLSQSRNPESLMQCHFCHRIGRRKYVSQAKEPSQRASDSREKNMGREGRNTRNC